MSWALYVLLPALVASNVYDLFMPNYKSGCADGCAEWSSVPNASALFIDGQVPAEAGAQCAMPGGSAGAHECDCGEKDADKYMTDSYAGPWCFCRNTTGSNQTYAYCSAPNSTVEQLNLQLATSSVVVAAFITYEVLPSSPAVAMLGTSEDNMRKIEGVSHIYSPPGRTYVMHYVPFRNLKPRQRYYYKVKSGSDACAWTTVFSFRAPYDHSSAGGVTRLATYGDMGHSRYNNMANLRADCAAGTIDAIVHMGDHAYDLGFSQDRRGDGYMNVFAPTLSTCPWMPIIGNHEASDGDHYKRYEQIAAGEMIGADGEGVGIVASADTALGQHLTLGRLYGSGVHGTVPSNTSRYTSTDIGLIHMAGIDIMNFDEGQMQWLERDLQAANANRAQVPWIMVMAHIQLYHSSLVNHWSDSADSFFSDKGENWRQDNRFESCWKALGGRGAQPAGFPCQDLGEWHRVVSGKLEPLLLKYGVDIYNAGHIHDYESTWPMKNGKVCQTSFDNPRCPVFIVEGNGGVPGSPGTCTVKNCSRTGTEWCRVHGNGCGAYGRITIPNATTLRYDHVANSDGKVMDTFTITQTQHGPFGEEDHLAASQLEFV